jgi:hypothetical protein
MKTTLEIPDDLFRQAKAKAALEGRNLKDLVADGLRAMVTGSAARSTARRVHFPVVKARQGECVITKRMVDDAEEQMLKEEAEYHAKFVRR